MNEDYFAKALEQPESIDVVKLTRDFFGTESPLRHAEKFGGRTYEDRVQQRDMAERIAKDMEDGIHLCVEAPTGVGKSFAYLVPAIFTAKKRSQPIVVTTHTIALQEQLFYKDLPLIENVLGVKIKAAIAKGRQNYLCLNRLRAYQDESAEFLPNMDAIPELKKISKWADSTEDGSLSDLPFKPNTQLWNSLCSETGVCPRDQKKHKGCFFQRSRRKVFAADVVIANHSMFCIDLATRRKIEDTTSIVNDRESGIMPDYCAVIVDEAHTFEEVAAVYMGLRFSSIGLYMTLNKLFHPKNHRGLLATASSETTETAIRTHELCSNFFSRLINWLEEQAENPLAYESAGHVPNLLDEPLSRLIQKINDFMNEIDETDDLYNELGAAVGRLTEYRDTLNAFLEMKVPDAVYWFERFGRDNSHVSLNAVPIEVNDILRKIMFENNFTAIMTSATMAVENDLTYFKKRLGCENADSVILDSPFDFAKQVELFLPDGSMPDPRDTENYVAACNVQIKRFVMQSDGRAFVLFTNYSIMNEIADLMEEFFEENDFQLLVQGRNVQRRQMLEAFKDDVRSVLFGTSSFWMGVDVPGDALTNVMITRLPFPVPSHPLTEAICKRIDQSGGNAFRDYSVPEAILRLRQGCGRLIRGKDDKGIIVILDPRIKTKFYGRYFINSLPKCKTVLF